MSRYKVWLLVLGIFIGSQLTACGGGDSGGQDTNVTPESYTVSTLAGSGGSISPASRSVQNGQTTTFTVSANTGYSIESVSGCGGNLNGNTFTTSAITGNCTVSASFKLNNYIVTASANAGGSISPENIVVEHGATTIFTVSPDTGYSIESVSGCGGSLNGNTYTTSSITADCSISASFKINSYTVTASASAGGSISPENTLVEHGATTTFEITTMEGYSINNVTGCNGSLDGNIYTTGPITDVCSVEANFIIDGYTVNANVGDGTVIYPAVIEGLSGERVSVRVALEPGYEKLTVSGCDGVLSGDIYTTAPLESNCAVATSADLIDTVYSVTFNIPEGFIVELIDSEGFTTEPTDTILAIKAGEAVRLLFTPPGNHRISAVQGNGGSWNGSIYVTKPILKNTNLFFSSEEVTADFKVWNTRVTPNALWQEDMASTPVCFEVEVTGDIEKVIMLPKYDVGVPMYDDGTHCDKTADDGIYSAEYIFSPDAYDSKTGDYDYRLIYAGNTVGTTYMQFRGVNAQGEWLYNLSDAYKSNGTHVSFISKQYAVQPEVVSATIQKTPHVFFIEQSDLTEDAVYPRLAKAKIDLMLGNNQFDFQINYQIGAQFSGVATGPSYLHQRTDAYGLGRDHLVQTEEMAGRLLGQVYMSTGIGTTHALSHEFMHAWGVFLNNPQLELQASSGHNIVCNSIGGIVGTTFIFDKNAGGEFSRSGSSFSYSGPASELELYLAGLLQIESLPSEMYFYRQDAEKHCLDWGDNPIPESEFFRVTPQDIVNVYGPRTVPDLSESRKEFQTLFMAVSDRVITDAEMAVIERIATYYESTDAAYEDELFPPFYWMTRKFGKMTTAIPDLN